MRPTKKYIEALKAIAATPLWGEPIADTSLRRELADTAQYDLREDAFEPSCDTESSQLRDAVETAREALKVASGNEGELTNTERARRAEILIVAYAARENRMDELSGTGGAETLVSDMLADFMHYAARFDIDFRNCLDIAAMHFDAEANDEGGQL